MVLDLKLPAGADLASAERLAPAFLSYVLSYVYVGIYWNNHHHLLHTVDRVDGLILWANLHLLVLAFAYPGGDQLVGGEPLRAAADRGLWRGPADARHRLSPAAKGDHAHPR